MAWLKPDLEESGAAAREQEGAPEYGGEYHMIRHTQQHVGGQSKISPLVAEEPADLGSYLPKFLVELSARTMRSLSMATFAPPTEESHLLDADIEAEDPHVTLQDSLVEFRRIPLVPEEYHHPVAAVDTSSIRIGETDDGIIGAIRGAIVWRVDRRYSFLRCGPLIFHIAASTASELLTLLGLGRFDPGEFPHGATGRVLIRIRNMFERWLQQNTVSTFTNAIVLLDGSLTTGTPDNPARNLQAILSAALERGNRILAFSKRTGLTIEGKSVTRLLDTARAPCLLDIDSGVREQFPAHPIKLLGRVYVGKFSASGYAFRVDIDRGLDERQAVHAAADLLTNDVVEQGYPETLRLAHIHATFTATEVIAMQRHIMTNYGAQIVNRFNLRRSLFGPFGTGRELMQ